jgi:regulatory protein
MFKKSAKPKLLDLEGLMAYSARVLSARAQTISELRQKLRRKAARPEDVPEVLDRLKQLGYLNDQRFAESFASWRRENQGLGQSRVVRDLLARRVAPAIAQKAAESAYSGADEPAMIEDFLARKYRGKKLGALLKEPKNLASAYRKLRTAGFSARHSVQVLKRYASDAERLEEMEE